MQHGNCVGNVIAVDHEYQVPLISDLTKIVSVRVEPLVSVFDPSVVMGIHCIFVSLKHAVVVWSCQPDAVYILRLGV